MEKSDWSDESDVARAGRLENPITRPLVYSNNSSTRLLVHLSTQTTRLLVYLSTCLLKQLVYSFTCLLVYSNNSSTRLLVYLFTRPLITSIDINQKNWQFDISNQKMMYVISAKCINLQHRQRLRILSMGILG